ncbi:MAG TPA: FAD-dependent oxidoreductase [Nitrolancea sp.]|nr:FAD-dependent oxidoreductase [Nitrolancea sp.]
MNITMYGTDWCRDCKRAKKFFGEQRVRYAFIDIDRDPTGRAVVEQVNHGKQIIPTILFEDGSTLVEPSNAQLAEKLGLQTQAKNPFYDLIVLGAGPAGLTAALYAGREGIDTLVIDRAGIGGQIAVTERLDNFPGFPDGISGAELADRFGLQAQRFGVEILSAQEVTSVGVEGDYPVVRTADGAEYCSWAVLLALGSTYRRLGIPGEDDFIGAGVHFCATCDGPFYRDQDVLVIGDGNSAGEESIFLDKFARHVTIAARGDRLSASKAVVEKLAEMPNIHVLYNTVTEEFVGDTRLRKVILCDLKTGERREIDPAGVFVFIGLSPNTEIVKDLVDLDASGSILTGDGLQTSVPGIFAAGDCRAGSTKQAASAAGEGAAVALGIRRYVESRAGGMPTREIEAIPTAGDGQSQD